MMVTRTTRHMAHASTVCGLTPGARITVKVDPQDPAQVMVWGGVAADVSQAAPAGDRMTRLERLADLRSQGLISEEELQQQKAGILAGE